MIFRLSYIEDSYSKNQPDRGWQLFIISVAAACVKALISAGRFMIGGIIDLKKLFRFKNAERERKHEQDFISQLASSHIGTQAEFYAHRAPRGSCLLWR